MRVAVLLTGFLRSYKSMFHSLEDNLLKKYNCDLYCITWDEQEDKKKINIDDFKIYNKYLKNYRIQSNIEYLSNKKNFSPLNRNGDVFKVNERAIHHGAYWANRLIDQWKLVYEGYNIIHNPNEYDIILRLRYDLYLKYINILNINSLIIPQDIGGWSFTDHMAYASPAIMKTYCDLHNNIEKLYIENNIDITHAVEMPKFYIIKNNINYLIDNTIKYGIIK